MGARTCIKSTVAANADNDNDNGNDNSSKLFAIS